MEQAIDNGVLSLLIPGHSNTYHFTMTSARAYPNGNYTWAGELVNEDFCTDRLILEDCEDGDILIVKTQDYLYGEFNVDNTFFRIEDLGGGSAALTELDLTYFSNQECGQFAPSPILKGEQSASEREISNCPIKVLVLYTDAALATNPAAASLASVGVESIKMILSNSLVSESKLQVQLAGVQRLTADQWTETGFILDDKLSLPSNPSILAYRTQYQADLVMLLTDTVYSKVSGAVTAFGDDGIDADSAFAIVEVGFVSAPRYTFAHEFGHLLGARHESKEKCASLGDDSGLPDAHGWRIEKSCNCFLTQIKFHLTIMHTFCNDLTFKTKMYYSNPNVKYKNKKFGKEDAANNAKILGEAACRISNYVPTLDDWCYIRGNSFVCPGEAVVLEAIYSGDEQPTLYTYKWESSLDGVTWFNLEVGTNMFVYNVEAPMNPNEKIIVRLVVTKPSGQILYAFHDITTKDDPACPDNSHNRSKPRGYTTSSSRDNGLLIFPNPSTGIFELVISEASDVSIKVEVLNQLGKVVKKSFIEAGKLNLVTIPLDISSLQDGIYMLRCQKGDISIIQKIIKTSY